MMFMEVLKFSAAVGTVWCALGFLLWTLIPVPDNDKVVYLMLVPPIILIGVMLVAWFRNIKSMVNSVRIP